ncbi:MAG: ankyrin repeat domain-containing protein, partial [Candidatus Dependentiae bacterium]|nr:ankyrin repeat domain-containing protein [Candidatus Dependentiae bacterium]
AGADLNIRNAQGETPLMIAAKAQNLEMVKALLAAKDKNGYPANVYAKNTYGGTALHDAAAYGTPEIVKELLASGSFINAQDKKHGITPLQAFYNNSHNNNIASAEALIDSGASEHIKNYKGDEAGYYISENGERLRTFNKFSNQNKSFGIDPKTKSTPLMRAIQSGDEPLVRALIAQGADVNAKDINGNTALHHLNSMEIHTTNGRSGLSQETRNRLIDAGANKNAKNKKGLRAKDVEPENSMIQAV